MAVMVLDHKEQARRRRRARVSQTRIAKRLNVATSKVSEYETRGEPLPWGLTADDYEIALAAELVAKQEAVS